MLCLEITGILALPGLGAFVQLEERKGAPVRVPRSPGHVSGSQRPCLRRQPCLCTQRAPHIWRRFQTYVEAKVRWRWSRTGCRPWRGVETTSGGPMSPRSRPGHGQVAATGVLTTPGPPLGAHTQGHRRAVLSCCRPLFVFCRAKTSC